MAEEEHERTVHPLDTSQEHEKLWLVKIPSEVAQCWKNIKESDEHLGELKWYPEKTLLNGNKKRKCTVTLKKFGSKTMVTEYNLDLKEPPQGMRIFSEESGGANVRMEGIVTNNCVLRPERNKQYRRVCRARLIATVKKDRFVQQIEGDATAHKSVVIRTGDAKVASTKKETDQKTRNRMDEDELREHMFHLFEKRSFWKQKELNAELQQPPDHLKKMLSELCIHHRKGEHKTYFELKPEYKGSSAAD